MVLVAHVPNVSVKTYPYRIFVFLTSSGSSYKIINGYSPSPQYKLVRIKFYSQLVGKHIRNTKHKKVTGTFVYRTIYDTLLYETTRVLRLDRSPRGACVCASPGGGSAFTGRRPRPSVCAPGNTRGEGERRCFAETEGAERHFRVRV